MTITCLTVTGQTLYGTLTEIDSEADALFYQNYYLFGTIERIEQQYLLTQGSNRWLYAASDCQLVNFKLLPEYRDILAGVPPESYQLAA